MFIYDEYEIEIAANIAFYDISGHFKKLRQRETNSWQ